MSDYHGLNQKAVKKTMNVKERKEFYKKIKKRELENYLKIGYDYGTAYKKTYRRCPSNSICDIYINTHPRIELGRFELSARTINKLESEINFINIDQYDYCESATHKYKDVIKEMNKHLKKEYQKQL